ncbi:hypothetical protein, partial [Paenibacillus xylanexedens]|uniref:hypothetical protein n=1 Tax=Paenibacillus xylanexedens TaxID=528191 RepID=UPI0016433BBA
ANGTLMIGVGGVGNALKADMKVERSASGEMSVKVQTVQVRVLNGEVGSVDRYLGEGEFAGMGLIGKDGEVLVGEGYGVGDEE